MGSNENKIFSLGNRGVVYEQWLGVDKSFEKLGDISTLSKRHPGYSFTILDDSEWKAESSTTSHAARMRGFFVPPYTGNYLFLAQGEDNAQVYISETDDPKDLVMG